MLTLTVQTIDTNDAFFALRREWDDLLDRIAGAEIFQTFEWLSTWWRYYGESVELCILAVYERDKLVGLAPLMKRERHIIGLPAFKQINFIGTGVSDRLDILLLPDKEQEVLKAIVYALMAQKWDIIDLQEIPEESVMTRCLPELMVPFGMKAEVTLQSTCPVSILPDTPEAFFNTLNIRHRRNIAYYDRRLRREHTVTVDFVYEESRIAEHMGEFLEVYRKYFMTKPGTRTVVNDQFAAFRREVVEHLASLGRAMLALLRVDDTLAAAQLCFVYKGICYDYNMCYDPDWRQRNVGTILLKEVIRHSIEQGYKAYDLLRGDEEYKHQWGTVPRRNVRVRVSRATPKMKLLEAGAGFMRAWRRKNEG